jgi:simple sugar transport system permease protein
MNNIESFILSTLSATVTPGTPLLFAFSARSSLKGSGVMNLGLEVSCCRSYWRLVASYQTSNLLLAILVAMLAEPFSALFMPSSQ